MARFRTAEQSAPRLLATRYVRYVRVVIHNPYYLGLTADEALAKSGRAVFENAVRPSGDRSPGQAMLLWY